MHRVYKLKPIVTFLSKILRSHELLAAGRFIDKHVIQEQEKALKQEKKRRKRGQRLNLVGEEDSGAQLFSPTRVAAARKYQAAKEETDRLNREGIESRKAAKAAKKE